MKIIPFILAKILVNGILEKIAFSDANYFSRIFRQYTNYTIRAYKKELAFQEENPV